MPNHDVKKYDWVFDHTEAIREVHRLRKELNNLHDYHQSKHLESLQKAHGHSLLSPQRQNHLRFARIHKRAHERITKILEGKP